MDSVFVSNLIKFNAQTNGRDKACRLFQYACRLVWGRLQADTYKDLIQTLKNIEYMFSMTRKLLRFGKSLDFIQGAIKSLQLKDTFLRLTLTLSKINQAFYLLFDHFLWFNNVGAVKLNKQYWSEVSAKFYLATIALNIIRDIYDIISVVGRETSGQSKSTGNGYQNHQESSKHRQKSVPEIAQENVPLILDSVKNLFDLAIPLCTLGKLSLKPSTQGMLGVVSSFIAVVTVWSPSLKLLPA